MEFSADFIAVRPKGPALEELVREHWVLSGDRVAVLDRGEFERDEATK